MTGHGNASKDNMEHFLRQLFRHDLEGKDFASHDESDALSIALCHALLEGRPPLRGGKKARTLGEAFRHLEVRP